MPASVSVHQGSVRVQAGVKSQAWVTRVPQGEGVPTAFGLLRVRHQDGARGARLTRALFL